MSNDKKQYQTKNKREIKLMRRGFIWFIFFFFTHAMMLFFYNPPFYIAFFLFTLMGFLLVFIWAGGGCYTTTQRM